MKKFAITALGRACIDLNSVEINQPMEETKTFKKYVGDLRQILRLVWPS